MVTGHGKVPRQSKLIPEPIDQHDLLEVANPTKRRPYEGIRTDDKGREPMYSKSYNTSGHIVRQQHQHQKTISRPAVNQNSLNKEENTQLI